MNAFGEAEALTGRVARERGGGGWPAQHVRCAPATRRTTRVGHSVVRVAWEKDAAYDSAVVPNLMRSRLLCVHGHISARSTFWEGSLTLLVRAAAMQRPAPPICRGVSVQRLSLRCVCRANQRHGERAAAICHATTRPRLTTHFTYGAKPRRFRSRGSP
eukprot:4777205-Pleurochrysis_carterae.AAC.2